MSRREAFAESTPLRTVVAPAQVPLPDAGRRVSCSSQRFGKNRLVERQPGRQVRLQHLRVRPDIAGQVLGNARPRRPASGQNASPGRRAIRGSGIRVGETDALRRQPINVRGAVVGVSVGADVGIAHVVQQQEYDVGALVASGCRLSVHGRAGGCQYQHCDRRKVNRKCPEHSKNLAPTREHTAPAPKSDNKGG